ncbi:ribonuclease HII [Colwellia sp. MT41]|uniref:Ribonuclease HII n=1 Tax=Colwellia marinimaniae TaxID=1513592 RepID=A0ABQ0MVH6_9GAMM|nr:MULTISPECIES: ribonuclease HII [Colwellia]ALO34338.1 ribonuclease HII [Colwellia sp. MT41]GAW96358.1 ribonuclease HII [Colwellia marinimaniae]
MPSKQTFPEFEYPVAYCIAGVDEVGRGPLVGDVVTAAVILDPDNPIAGLKDSKKLSEKKRAQLSIEIKAKAIAWSIGRASPQEIDSLNILHATMLAMQRAVTCLSVEPDFVLVDGNRCPTFLSSNREGQRLNGKIASQAVVKGDARVAEISAASIIAKVARDAEMIALDKLHPEYGFAKHKGYPTKLHLEKIIEHGVLDCYRQSFKPVARVLGTYHE